MLHHCYLGVIVLSVIDSVPSMFRPNWIFITTQLRQVDSLIRNKKGTITQESMLNNEAKIFVLELPKCDMYHVFQRGFDTCPQPLFNDCSET